MVKLYSTGCSKCNVLKNKLESSGVSYELITDVDKMLELGFTESPMLVVEEQVLNYYNAIKWVFEKGNVKNGNV